MWLWREGPVKIVWRVKRGVNQKIPLSFAVTASVVMQTCYQIVTNFGLRRSETNSNFSGEHAPRPSSSLCRPKAILPHLLSHCKVHPKSKSRGNDFKEVGLKKIWPKQTSDRGYCFVVYLAFAHYHDYHNFNQAILTWNTFDTASMLSKTTQGCYFLKLLNYFLVVLLAMDLIPVFCAASMINGKQPIDTLEFLSEIFLWLWHLS